MTLKDESTFRASSPDRRMIGMIGFDGVTAMDACGPMEVFGCARHRDGSPAYQPLLIGLDERPIESESGLRLLPNCTLANAPALDTLMVPGGSGLRQGDVGLRVGEWMRERAATTRRLVSICTGIYAFAQSGLLDGRRVTTHWAFADDVAERFPALKMDAEQLFVRDGHCYTTGGVTAGIDLSLALVEEDLGTGAALAVAREMLVYLKRSGGQSQYSEALQRQSAAQGRFAGLLAWIEAHLSEPIDVNRLAAQACLGVRHFSRAFRAALGCSPAIYVERQRLQRAQQWLLDTARPVETIGLGVGFASAAVFRRAFERQFGVSPSAYRARFAGRGSETGGE